MPDITYIDFSQPTINANWLNDVNVAVYRAIGTGAGGSAPTTPADVRVNLGLTASSGSSLVGFLQSGSGATARTAQAKLRDVVSVKDFGAVGDGVTNDTTAVQAALTYAAANNLVLTGDGTNVCLIGTTITASSGNVKLRNLRLKASALATEMLNLSGTVASTDINSCSFDANNSAYATIKADTISNVQITNCTFKNTFNAGTSYGLWLRDTSSVTISNCLFDGASGNTPRQVFIQAAAANCKDVVIDGNCFQNITSSATDGDAIVCDDPAATDNSVIVSNNTFRNIYKRAVKAGGSNWVITGNTVFDCKNYSVFSLYGAKNFVISDNTVRCQSATTNMVYAIDVGATGSVENVYITNNNFEFPAANITVLSLIRTNTNVTNLVAVGNSADYCQYFFAKGSTYSLSGAFFLGNKTTQCGDHEFILQAGTVNNILIDGHTSSRTVASRVLFASFATLTNTSITNCNFDKSFGLTNGVRLNTGFGNVNAGALVTTEVYSEARVQGYRSSAPVSGTYSVGDIFFNTTPVAGGPTGFVCTTAGTPGTWCPFGYSVLTGSATYDPPSLNDGDGVTTTLSVTGAAVGDFVLVSFSLNLQGIVLTAWVSSANTVSVRFQNETGGVVDLSSGTINVQLRKP